MLLVLSNSAKQERKTWSRTRTTPRIEIEHNCKNWGRELLNNQHLRPFPPDRFLKEKKRGWDGFDSVPKYNAHINTGSGGGAGGKLFPFYLWIWYVVRFDLDMTTIEKEISVKRWRSLWDWNTNIWIQKYQNTFIQIKIQIIMWRQLREIAVAGWRSLWDWDTNI